MKKNRYTIELAQDLDAKLEYLADQKGISKADLIRRALALYALVDEKTTGDRELAIVSEDVIKFLIALP